MQHEAPRKNIKLCTNFYFKEKTT